MPLRSIGSLLRSVAALAVLVLAAWCGAAQASALSFPRHGELSFDALLQLPQWRRVADRLPAEEASIRACLKGARCEGTEASRLAELVASLMTASPRRQVEEVHARFNRKPYREDIAQFGRKDLWQTPLSFAARGGDCEDFAIAKYFTLKLLGFTDQQMRIAVMVNHRRAEVHAVLLVDLEGQWMVLDNRARNLRTVASYGNWSPQYAVTEARAWRYRTETEPKVAQAESPLTAPAAE